MIRFKANDKFYKINDKYFTKEILQSIIDTNKIRGKEMSERQKNLFSALYKKLKKK